VNRRTAILLGSFVAALAAAEIVVLSGLLAAERHDDRNRYRDAIARQRRAAGRRAHASTAEQARQAPTTFCVRGVETFAASASRTLQKPALNSIRHLDMSIFRELSNLAIRAERYVEQANAGPALPQRMGRSRVGDPGQGISPPLWEPIKPSQIECEDGDAYAVFRLDVGSTTTVTPMPDGSSIEKRK